MKWLNVFKKKRGHGDEGQEEESGDTVQELSVKRRSIFRPSSAPFRASLDLWFEARKARRSVDGHTTTTDHLTVYKAGVTILINRTYMVIKHLGSGTYGQVRLAFNLSDRKLYAIKACKKSQLSGSNSRPVSKRVASLNRHRRALCNLFQRNNSSKTAAFTTSSSTSTLTTGDSGCPHGSASQPNLDVRLASSVPNQGCSSSSALSSAHCWPNSCSGMASDAGCVTRAEEFVREIAILKKLSHPNIVRLCEVVDDPTSDNLLLVMEYVEGVSLSQKQLDTFRWQTLPEHDVWRYTRDVLRGLDYLHGHGVVHGDLKPANLMLDSNTGAVKIVDFGSAILNHDRAGHSYVPGACSVSGATCMSCTPAYRSPESLQSGYRPSYELDLWALGVSIYKWVVGTLPFCGAAPFLMYDKIKSQEVELPEGLQISPELKDFILRLLDKDPFSRLDVAAAMIHPWITAHGSVALVQLGRQSRGYTCGLYSAPSLRALSAEELADAIKRPKGAHASEMMEMIFEEVRLPARHTFINTGDSADHVYLVTQGEVEIYHDFMSVEGPSSPDEPIITGLGLWGPMSSDEDDDEDDFLNFTQLAPHQRESSSGCAGLLGLMDISSASRSHGKRTSSTNTKSLETLPSPSCVVLAVRGPGDSLGLAQLGSSKSLPVWRASVRTRSEVSCYVARVDALKKLAAQYPEVASALKHMAVQQETDMAVAEALRKLRLVGEQHLRSSNKLSMDAVPPPPLVPAVPIVPNVLPTAGPEPMLV